MRVFANVPKNWFYAVNENMFFKKGFFFCFSLSAKSNYMTLNLHSDKIISEREIETKKEKMICFHK